MLLLPDNVRIRRYNLSSKQYSDYVDNAEHIQALDYIWDPEDQGLSKTITHYLKTTAKQCSAFGNVFIPQLFLSLAHFICLMKPHYSFILLYL